MKNKIKLAHERKIPIDIFYRYIESNESICILEFEAFLIRDFDEKTGTFDGYEEKDINLPDNEKFQTGNISSICKILDFSNEV